MWCNMMLMLRAAVNRKSCRTKRMMYLHLLPRIQINVNEMLSTKMRICLSFQVSPQANTATTRARSSQKLMSNLSAWEVQVKQANVERGYDIQWLPHTAPMPKADASEDSSMLNDVMGGG